MCIEFTVLTKEKKKSFFFFQRNAMWAFLKFPLTVQTSENAVPLSSDMIHNVKTWLLSGYGSDTLDLVELMKMLQTTSRYIL